ncbi:MAG: TIR domain-containing protein [Chloroflexi bacterium]|nr:TIR domain-containing protein [Chloroflexota bacterium]
MPKLKLYNLFISHAWAHGDDYHCLVHLLDAAPHFNWHNYSVPHDKPVLGLYTIFLRRYRLIKKIDQQSRPTNCVLVICGMYVARKAWCKREIFIAEKYDKPIIGILPRSNERIPVVVKNAAVDIVHWNTDSIVDAVRKHAL